MVFDAMQEIQVDGLIEEAEGLIDGLSADSWLVPSPGTEIYYPTGDLLDLLNAPVLSVTSVTARSLAVGDTAQTLVSGSDYELIDAARGTLSIPGRAGQQVTVAYTYTSPPVPTMIRRAATLLVADWMRPRLVGGGSGIEQVTVGDVSVKYGSSSGGGDAIPTRVRELIAQARRPIFV